MIIFVSDAFVEHYVGGAELTTEALIQTSLLPSYKILSNQINVDSMEDNKEHFWIFANFANLSDECLLYAAKNLNYSVLEYDYKFCKYRSIEKHVEAEGSCKCQDDKRGKLVSIFLNLAKATWWMSEKQKNIYKELFPFLSEENNKVLSSVISDNSLDLIESYDTSNKNDKWIILNSGSWIKGVPDAIKYAKENNLNYELVWGMEHKQFLKKLAESKGLIFLPPGGDTCPRLVMEAQLLGCELVLNENVQHKDEEWFANKDSSMNYLRQRTKVFWNEISSNTDFGLPVCSATKNKNSFKFIIPFYNASKWITKCIDSVKKQNYENFECFLIDDMSTDNSYTLVENMAKDDPRFTLIKNKEKKYALENIANAIQEASCKDDDVIILLDGDDWLSSLNVLTKLNEVYDSECLLTYGSYIYFPNGQKGVEPSEYPMDVVKNNKFRKDVWRASHLRTFKYVLWKNIDHNDLKDKENNYYKMTYDQAILLPLLEMAGPRAKYIPDVLYVYNRTNPLNVDKEKAEEQYKLSQEIRNKKCYDRLKL